MTHIVDGMGNGVAWGTLAASAAFTLTLVASLGRAISGGEVIFAMILFVPAMIMALLWILAATLMLGLPMVWLLRKIHCATREVIGVAGGLVGASVFLGPQLAGGAPYDPDLWAFCIVGLIGGGVTGAVWGAEQELERQSDLSSDHPNRLHDDRMLR